MPVLPDYLAPGLRAVICGAAADRGSMTARHYYAGPGNEFWQLLYESGILPVLLRPEDDAQVLLYGIGLTDLRRHRVGGRDGDRTPATRSVGATTDLDVPGLIARLRRHRPGLLVFHGKQAAREVSRRLGHGREIRLGRQPWTLVLTPVFVLPSGSPANRDPRRLDGKPTRLAWFQLLARELDAMQPAPLDPDLS